VQSSSVPVCITMYPTSQLLQPEDKILLNKRTNTNSRFLLSTLRRYGNPGLRTPRIYVSGCVPQHIKHIFLSTSHNSADFGHQYHWSEKRNGTGLLAPIWQTRWKPHHYCSPQCILPYHIFVKFLQFLRTLFPTPPIMLYPEPRWMTYIPSSVVTTMPYHLPYFVCTSA